MFQIPQFQLAQIQKLELTGNTTFPAAAIEKDLAISAVLQVVAAIELEGLSVGFGGGTSLVKARGLMDRLSEDVDLKLIVSQEINRTRRRALLRTHRDLLLGALEDCGFSVGSTRTKLEGQFRQFILEYQSHFSGGRFTSEIQLELWQQIELLPMERLRVQTILNAQLGEAEPHNLEMQVVNLNETAAQKVVALLVNVTHILERPKLVRHIYDIWRISPENLTLDLALQVFDYSLEELTHRHAAISSPIQGWKMLMLNLQSLRGNTVLRRVFDVQISQVANRPVSAQDAFEAFDSLAVRLLQSSRHRSQL